MSEQPIHTATYTITTMGPTTFQTPLRITHVGTATAVIKLEGLTILTDPYFSPAGTKWQAAAVPGVVLSSSYQPALSPQDLPPIDLVLLSHEDHEDNLDDLGRLLLDGRHTLTNARRLAETAAHVRA